MLDTIFIENIVTQAVIGIHKFEKSSPQKLIISVELGTDIRQSTKNDQIKYALDYEKISTFIDDFIKASNYNLIETLAENLVSAMFENFTIQSIKLRLQKPGAIAYTQNVGLIIHRYRP